MRNYVTPGNKNTKDIVNDCSEPNIAARLCNDLVLNGYDDWYLPSKDELSRLIANLYSHYAGVDLWSSSEYNATEVWGYYFSGGMPIGMVPMYKNFILPMQARAIRTY